MICLLAGRAAEKLVLGCISAGAGGAAESDLARATALACATDLSFGLGAETLWVDPPEQAYRELRYNTAQRRKTQARIDRAEAAAFTLLKDYRGNMTRLAEMLVEKNVLFGPELEQFFKGIDRTKPSQTTMNAKCAKAKTMPPAPQSKTRPDGPWEP